MIPIKRLDRLLTTVTKASSYFSLTPAISNPNKYHTCISSKKLQSVATKSSNQFINETVCINREVLCRYISSTPVCYAKGKDKGKEKKKTKAAKLDLRELSEAVNVEEITSQLNQSVDNMKADFIKNLTVRSTSGSVEQLLVKFDGKEYEMQELAQISRKPKFIVLNVAGFPTAIPAILKTIQQSGLNINPQQDGTTIFLPIPKVTKEHRENLSKNAKAIFIRYRDEIKDTRNKVVKSLKKKTDMSEDAIRRMQGQVEALCEKYLKEAESLLETKQNELTGSQD